MGLRGRLRQRHWALRGGRRDPDERELRPFLCPRCRAGLCMCITASRTGIFPGFYALVVGLGFAGSPDPGPRSRDSAVSMPSLSGWALHVGYRCGRGHKWLFLCPRCRAGLCMTLPLPPETFRLSAFLCPRCRAGLCMGCPWEVSLTCAFAGHRAILAATDHAGKPFRASEQSPTSRPAPMRCANQDH